jgi:uncharacterized protein DUF6970
LQVTIAVALASLAVGVHRQAGSFGALIIAGCGTNPAAPDTSSSEPIWVMALIRQLGTEPVANPPAFVARYNYKGQDVYFAPQRCCDVMSVV